MPRPEVDKQTAIAALECALHNYQIDRVGPYTLAIISQADLAILEYERDHYRKALEWIVNNTLDPAAIHAYEAINPKP